MHCVPNYIIVFKHLYNKFLRFLKVRYTARTTKILTFIIEFIAQFISHHCRSLFLHIALRYSNVPLFQPKGFPSAFLARHV